MISTDGLCANGNYEKPKGRCFGLQLDQWVSVANAYGRSWLEHRKAKDTGLKAQALSWKAVFQLLP
jgi:hypothetical protein